MDYHFEDPDFTPYCPVETQRGPDIITVPVPGDNLETIQLKMKYISNVILRHGGLWSYRSPSTEALNRRNRSQDAAAAARVEMTELEKISSIWDFPTATIYHAAWILKERSARFFVTAMAKYFAFHEPMEAENDRRDADEAEDDEIWLLLNVRECLRISLAHERARAAELTQNIESYRDVVAARIGAFEP